ncbi:MAG: hypothetical protein JW791_01665 [Nanoarchaeota archaeon]|nr:hypothetical protein [Nanoarchaeota archaeon]
MVNCLRCNNKLTLVIDLKNSNFKCKKCDTVYDLIIKDKIVSVGLDGKSINFFLNDISFFNNELSKKTIYELYNKGYVKCIKTLNTAFNDHYNNWELSLDNLKNNVINNSNKTINSLTNSLKRVNLSQANYSCPSCGFVLSFEEAVNANFLCNACSENLKIFDPVAESNEINNKIEYIKEKILTLERGWC